MGDFVPTMQVLRSRNDLLFFQLPYFEIFWKHQKSSTKYAYNQLIINLPTFIKEQIGNKNGN